MDNSYIDEVYAILDEMNNQIEDMLSEYGNSETADIIISVLNQKSHKFIEELQQEIQMVELIEL